MNVLSYPCINSPIYLISHFQFLSVACKHLTFKVNQIVSLTRCSPLLLLLYAIPQWSKNTYFTQKGNKNSLNQWWMLNLCVSAGSRSGSPGRLLSSTYGRLPRPTMGTAAAATATSTSTTMTDKSRPRGHRSHGCSRETSPTRSSTGEVAVYWQHLIKLILGAFVEVMWWNYWFLC